MSKRERRGEQRSGKVREKEREELFLEFLRCALQNSSSMSGISPTSLSRPCAVIITGESYTKELPAVCPWDVFPQAECAVGDLPLFCQHGVYCSPFPWNSDTNLIFGILQSLGQCCWFPGKISDFHLGGCQVGSELKTRHAQGATKENKATVRSFWIFAREILECQVPLA